MLQLYCTAFQRMRISSSSSCAPAAASLADTKATVIYTFLRCLGVIHVCINCLLLILGRMSQDNRYPGAWSDCTPSQGICMHVQANRLKGLQQDYGRGFDTEYTGAAQYAHSSSAFAFNCNLYTWCFVGDFYSKHAGLNTSVCVHTATLIMNLATTGANDRCCCLQAVISAN